MALELGVDISNWSGPITAEQVDCWKRSGISFCVCGTQREDIYWQQAQIVAGCGLDLQAYSYFYFSYDPLAQVKEAARIMASPTSGFPQPSRWWLDFEASPGGFDAEMITDWLIRLVDAAALRPWPIGIYTGYWWWPVTGNTRAFIDLPLWVALYDGRPTLDDCPELVPGWKPVMKQYRGSHNLCGVTVDANVREKEEDMAYQTPEQRRLTLAMHAQLAVQSRQFGDPMDKLLEPVPDDLWAAGWAYIGVADPPPQPELVEGAYTTALTVTAVPERVPWDRGRGR